MKYSPSHEWALIEGATATIGISEYAQKELGDIVYVELPKLGHAIQAGGEAVVLESTKAAVDIYSPLSGKVIAVNTALIQNPEKINASAENEGWLFKLELSDLAEAKELLEREAYLKLIAS